MKSTVAVTAGSSGGISLGIMLSILFAVLKLTHTVTWSWWLVLTPAFISVGLSALFVVVFVVIATLIIANDT